MLTKRKNSPYYYAVLYSGKAQQKWISLKTKDKTEAKFLYGQLKEKLFSERREAYISKILGKPALPAYGPSAVSANIEASGISLIEALDKAKELKTISAGSIEWYKRFVSWILSNMPMIKTVEQVDKKTALAYMQSNYSDAAPKSYNTIKSALSVVWKSLAVYDIQNPWQAVPNKSFSDSEPYRPLKNQEVTSILDNTEGFWHDATLISYYTGLRKIDIFELEWKSIKKDCIELVPSKTSRNKKAVVIPLHPDLIKLFKRRKKTEDKVFTEAKYNSGTFQKQFSKILTNLEITDSSEGKASFHSLRATFITNCEANGVPRQVLQGIVGHGSPNMTQRYSHDTESGKVIKNLPSILTVK